MKSKKSLIFGIIITVFLVFGLATLFMPYIKITTKDLTESIKLVFGDMEEYIGEISEDSLEKITESKSGINIVDELMSLKINDDTKQIKKVKTFVLVCMFVSFVFALASIVLNFVLKGKLKYIFIISFSLISCVSMLCIFIFLPNVLSDSVVVGVEEMLVDDSGENADETNDDNKDDTIDIAVEESLRDTITEWIKEFARELLNRTVAWGYWLYIALMGLAIVASICGLILDKKIFAKIYVLTGAYKGASLDVDGNIVVGRDPSMCQLIMDGEQVSRKHCKIGFNASTGKYLVTDYSTNGTYYTNGKRLDENVTVELDCGTIILIGKNGDKLKLG